MISKGGFFLAAALIVRTCSPLASPRKQGFGAAPKRMKKPAVPASINDETAEQTIRSLFAVCSHLQNPELYVPSWASVCDVIHNDEDGSSSLVASQAIERGDIISFYPVHSIGLRGNNDKKKKKKKKKEVKRSSDYLVFDSEIDGKFFGSERRTTNFCIDFPAMTEHPELRGQSLFLDVNSERVLVPGWVGHLAQRETSKENANCAAIPLQGAAPLCMVIATQDVNEGETLVRDIASNEGEVVLRERITQSGDLALDKYAPQLAELKAFTDMAYPSSRKADEVTSVAKDEETIISKEDEKEATPAPQTFQKINLEYPGLQEFNSDPDIYAVDNFLTAEECDRVIAKCQPHMVPCLTKDSFTGVVGPDEWRTSTETSLPRAETPSIVTKLISLLNCTEEQLEILQVLRYEKGQEFKPHTDGFDGPVTASGFENSGRMITVFTYLNDVRQGGHTNFPKLGFSVAPKKGSAVIHFPATESLQEDGRTLHQGMPAVDEKWLLATWVWQHERTDERYNEKNLPKLSEDVI